MKEIFSRNRRKQTGTERKSTDRSGPEYRPKQTGTEKKNPEICPDQSRLIRRKSIRYAAKKETLQRSTMREGNG